MFGPFAHTRGGCTEHAFHVAGETGSFPRAGVGDEDPAESVLLSFQDGAAAGEVPGSDPVAVPASIGPSNGRGTVRTTHHLAQAGFGQQVRNVFVGVNHRDKTQEFRRGGYPTSGTIQSFDVVAAITAIEAVAAVVIGGDGGGVVGFIVTDLVGVTVFVPVFGLRRVSWQ